jgi:hypothetical protein
MATLNKANKAIKINVFSVVLFVASRYATTNQTTLMPQLMAALGRLRSAVHEK